MRLIRMWNSESMECWNFHLLFWVLFKSIFLVTNFITFVDLSLMKSLSTQFISDPASQTSVAFTIFCGYLEASLNVVCNES
jgi:hypothetical protein